MKALDVGRTRLALSLNVTPLADCRYRVRGGTAEHVVRTAAVPWSCDCRDAAYRPGLTCKHTTAVYFAQRLHPAVRDALRSAVGAS